MNKLLCLSAAERRAGVIAMSAGNHAQAVACHATWLGIRSTIVMPAFTPFTKVERTEALGARVVLHGESLNDAQSFAAGLAARDGLVFVHPATTRWSSPARAPRRSNSWRRCAGPRRAGGARRRRRAGRRHVAAAALALRPELPIYGVQCALYPSMHQALSGAPITGGGITIAEGIAVKSPAASPAPWWHPWWTRCWWWTKRCWKGPSIVWPACRNW